MLIWSSQWLSSCCIMLMCRLQVGFVVSVTLKKITGSNWLAQQGPYAWQSAHCLQRSLSATLCMCCVLESGLSKLLAGSLPGM